MELQNMRFENQVEFITDVPDELLGYEIPKLTFQPIVENALLHGIMMKEEKRGTILIAGWREEGDLVFIISDDGAGIPPKKLETLLADDADAGCGPDKSGPAPDGTDGFGTGYRASSRHIGVYNTNLRLKNLYGEKYGLSFTSVAGEGTEVTVRVPAMKHRQPDSL